MDLKQLIEAALLENEQANDALCEYLKDHRDATRAVVGRTLAGEHVRTVLVTEQAASRRDAYLDALHRFEESRRTIRMLVLLWAKQELGISFRSMGTPLGISPQMAVKLGHEGTQRYGLP